MQRKIAAIQRPPPASIMLGYINDSSLEKFCYNTQSF